MSFTAKISSLALKSACKFSAAALLLMHATAWAQNYPAKNITLIVPYPAGGGTDLFARAIAQDMGRQFERQIVIDNRSGASGNIGAEAIARANPDGYTIGTGNTTNYSINRAVLPRLPYDADRDFQAVAYLSTQPNMLGVTMSLPVKTVQEAGALASRNNPTVIAAMFNEAAAKDAVDAAIHRIEERLLSSGEREINSGQIGELVMRELKKLDKVAYVRFASVYRSFEDVDEFRQLIRDI